MRSHLPHAKETIAEYNLTNAESQSYGGSITLEIFGEWESMMSVLGSDIVNWNIRD